MTVGWKMNKFLMTTDLHLTSNESDNYRWEIFPFIKKLIKREDINYLVFLGDLTEEKDNHNSILINRICKEFKELSYDLIKIFILKGNHDYYNEDNPFFYFLNNSYNNNIWFITEPLELYDELNNYLFLPNTKDPIEKWKNFNFKKYDYIFMHQPIVGAIGMNEYEIKKGLPSDYFTIRKDAVIYSGDIHKKQKIGNITYIGTPYPIYFGDNTENSGLYIVDIIEREERIIPFPTIKKMNIEIFPFENNMNDFNLSADDQIKVKVNLHQRDLFNYDKIKKEIQNYCKENNIYLKSIEMKIIKEELISKKEKVIKKDITDSEIIKMFSSKEKLDFYYINKAEELIEEYNNRGN